MSLVPYSISDDSDNDDKNEYIHHTIILLEVKDL